MNFFVFLSSVVSLTNYVSGHMILSYLPSLRYEGNPYVLQADIDYSLSSPLNADGSNFPCKGYQSDLGSEAGASVATWATSGLYNFTLLRSATHDGGSYQASLSYDKGKSFTVIHSYISGCPEISPPGGSFQLNIPSDAPTGAALLAWTWFNSVGNREIYMNCASITISGVSAQKGNTSIAFSSRPSIFVANLQNGCNTILSTNINFPDPGPDMTNVFTQPGTVTGTCQAVDGIGAFGSTSTC